MSDTLAMGGYGAYVWSSIALTAIVLFFCTGLAWRRQRKILNDIRTQLRAMESTE
jgi:heme exporter protein CcmD